jgi:AcrR family transcriptional regulator
MTADVSPPRRNSPLRQAQAAATRLRIVEAAHAEFEARGYEGTRIEDIAARAGVAQLAHGGRHHGHDRRA